MLFNTIGYRLLLYYKSNASTVAINQKIDAQQYAEADLMELTIPLNMPYYSDQPLENTYGEIEIKGTHYAYVKRMVSNNELHIWCLPNKSKTALQQLKNQSNAALSAHEPNNKPAKNNTLKIFEYDGTIQSNSTMTPVLNPISQPCNSYYLNSKPQFEPSSIQHPPEVIA